MSLTFSNIFWVAIAPEQHCLLKTSSLLYKIWQLVLFLITDFNSAKLLFWLSGLLEKVQHEFLHVKLRTTVLDRLSPLTFNLMGNISTVTFGMCVSDPTQPCGVWQSAVCPSALRDKVCTCKTVQRANPHLSSFSLSSKHNPHYKLIFF